MCNHATHSIIHVVCVRFGLSTLQEYVEAAVNGLKKRVLDLWEHLQVPLRYYFAFACMLETGNSRVLGCTPYWGF